MSNADFNELLNRYLNDSLSADELRAFVEHLQKHENTEALRQALQQALQNNTFKELSDKSHTDFIFRKIMQQAENGPPPLEVEAPVLSGPRKMVVWLRWTAAAAVLIAVLWSAYYILIKDKPVATMPVAEKQASANDRAPGGNKAILQLADGSFINLDDTDTGTLAQQGNTKILKLNNGQLKYNCIPSNNAPILYNTISTPRGGQYHIILPDGSKVWLNAASSLRFPTVFAGKERSVQLTGEAYFEIASIRLVDSAQSGRRSGQKMPFHVQVNNMKVEVLGTHFNVMSYDNEKTINTTLLEGRVRVSAIGPGLSREQSAILKPNQQAVLSHDARLTIHADIDTEEVIAWKNGLFQFNSADIQTIMRQIERWYDVDVQYKGPIPQGTYSGIVPRGDNLLKVLRIFEESDLKFTIEGRKLTVL
jgi:transmembrane sensor